MINTLLFDFDGVIADTESVYDVFWNTKSKQLDLGIDNFAKLLKGRTLKSIMAEYFASLPKDKIDFIISDLRALESNMDYNQISGSVDFLRRVKGKGYKIALVTSSSINKMNVALKKLQIAEVFDAIVTSDLVKEGKPNPECFLKGASMLNADSKNCIVFEDSLSGMQAAISAKMNLFALETTVCREKILPFTKNIFKDFTDSDKILKDIELM